jgi:hypothetical protein
MDLPSLCPPLDIGPAAAFATALIFSDQFST